MDFPNLVASKHLAANLPTTEYLINGKHWTKSKKKTKTKKREDVNKN